MHNPNKNFYNFLLLWSGEFISAVGSGLTSFGLGVYVFEQTGQASAMALVTLLAFLPGLLLSVPAGVLADRYDRRLLMLLGDGLSAVGLIFILICVLRGGAQVWQICVGVTISSLFSALMDPAYKATVTDLLTPEQYTKASGLIGIAGSAKYLVSPILAGFLLTLSDIRLLLIIDICTFFLTVFTTLAVRGMLLAGGAAAASSKKNREKAFFRELKTGWRAVSQRSGVLLLVLLSSVITFFLGYLQTLFTPMVLAFSDSATLGTAETICALGMLVSSIVIGMVSLKKGYVKILSLSLAGAGFFMAVFGLKESIPLMCASGFFFFAMLPFANTALDYLLRTNIDNTCQGRAWGLIGVLSQVGYVAAYALAGVLADAAARIMGVSVGRGAAQLITASGILLAATAFLLYHIKAIRSLEKITEKEACHAE